MEHLDHRSPHFNDAKMARFSLLRAFIIALGGMGMGMGDNCSILYCPRSWTKEMEHLDHPSPHFNNAKMARFCSFPPSSLLFFLGGGGRWMGDNCTILYFIHLVVTSIWFIVVTSRLVVSSVRALTKI